MPTTSLMIEALLDMRHGQGGVPEDRFWLLVERFRADLVNQALALLGNQQDAEDVSQETLCKAFLELHTLRDAAKLGAWLRAINRCNALSFRRRKQRTKEERLDTGQLTALPAPGEAAPPPAPDEALVRAVDGLPEVFREVVVLRYWEKLVTDEIALRLNIPSGTVRSRLARADGMLAEKLKLLRRREEDRS